MTRAEFLDCMRLYQTLAHDLRKWFVWFTNQPSISANPDDLVNDWYKLVREFDHIHLVTVIEQIADGKLDCPTWFEHYETGAFFRRHCKTVRARQQRIVERADLLAQVNSQGDYDEEAKRDFEECRKKLKGE